MNELYEKFLVPIMEKTSDFSSSVAETVFAILPDIIEEQLVQIGEAILPMLNALPETIGNFLEMIFGF